MKPKKIIEGTILYAKSAAKQYNTETKKADLEAKHKTEVFLEDEEQDGENVLPSYMKLKSDIPKEQFQKGPAKFEVEIVPYKIGDRQAQVSIKILKIIK